MQNRIAALLAMAGWTCSDVVLASPGLHAEAELVLEFQGNPVGGVRRDVYALGIVLAVASWDLGAAFGGPAPRLGVMGLATFGGDPTTGMGDAQFVSNIEAPDGIQLFQYWIEQPLLDEALVIRFGVYDIDDVLFALDSALLFTQSSHGFAPDLSGAGFAGPPTFPTSGLTGHLAITVEDGYGLVVVAEGTPTNPLSTIDVTTDGNSGAFIVAEIGWKRDGVFKYALGGWSLSADRPDLESGQSRSGDRGVYAFFEHAHHDDGGRGPAVFFRVGAADEAVNPIAGYVGGGVVFTGPFEARPDDRAGFAVAAANAGNGSHDDVWETAFELTYAAAFLGALDIQPFVHWVVHPSFLTARANLVALGLRTTLRL